MNRLATSPMLISAVLALGASAAACQTVYRCGPAANHYSQQPCRSGNAVDVSDPRSPAQAAEARSAVRDQQRLGADMARERRAEEAAHKPAMAGGIPISPRAEAAKKPTDRRKKSASSRSKRAVGNAVVNDSREFVALAPGSGKKKKKAQD